MKLILRVVGWWVALWPPRIHRMLARLLAGPWAALGLYRMSVIRSNLAIAFPEKSDEERNALARAAVEHLLLTFLEFFALPKMRARGLDNVRFAGEEHLRAARANGRGVLLLSGHMGSFETAAQVIQAHSPAEPLSLVVRSFSPAFQDYATSVRCGGGVGLIAAGKGGLKQIGAALAKNETVAFVLDQGATEQTGVFVDFFGKSVPTMNGLALIALRTKATVLPVATHRDEQDVHHVVFYEPIPIERKGSVKETVVHMTQVYTKFIEDRIREHPAQWLWTHKRFKRARS